MHILTPGQQSRAAQSDLQMEEGTSQNMEI